MQTSSYSDLPPLQDKDTILMVSSPGLRQENLLAILRTVPGAPLILSAETVDEVESLLGVIKATLILIDHTLAREQVRKAIQAIHSLDPKAWILLLAAHPRDAYAFEDARPDAVLCDGFSRTELIEGIQKAKLFPQPDLPEIQMDTYK